METKFARHQHADGGSSSVNLLRKPLLRNGADLIRYALENFPIDGRK